MSGWISEKNGRIYVIREGRTPGYWLHSLNHKVFNALMAAPLEIRVNYGNPLKMDSGISNHTFENDLHLIWNRWNRKTGEFRGRY